MKFMTCFLCLWVIFRIRIRIRIQAPHWTWIHSTATKHIFIYGAGSCRRGGRRPHWAPQWTGGTADCSWPRPILRDPSRRTRSYSAASRPTRCSPSSSWWRSRPGRSRRLGHNLSGQFMNKICLSFSPANEKYYTVHGTEVLSSIGYRRLFRWALKPGFSPEFPEQVSLEELTKKVSFAMFL